MGYGIKLNHFIKHYLMENAEELTVFNWGVELHSDYFKKNHRGLLKHLNFQITLLTIKLRTRAYNS